MYYIISILIILSPLSMQIFATEPEALLKQCAKNLSKHTHFTATFTQKRHMSLFKKPLISEGIISFSDPDKILFHYKTPFESIILLNGHTMKRFRIENGSYIEQPSIEIIAKAISRVMIKFLKGDLGDNVPFDVSIKKNIPNAFILIPHNAMARSVFSSFELIFSKNQNYIKEIKLIEHSGDYIQITHQPPSFKPIPESRFRLLDDK